MLCFEKVDYLTHCVAFVFKIQRILGKTMSLFEFYCILSWLVSIKKRNLAFASKILFCSIWTQNTALFLGKTMSPFAFYCSLLWLVTLKHWPLSSTVTASKGVTRSPSKRPSACTHYSFFSWFQTRIQVGSYQWFFPKNCKFLSF